MINLELPQPDPFTNLNVTLLLESLTSGEVVASVREFPDCQVKAETREAAIAQIQATFLERLKNIEAISWNVPIQASEPTWMKLAGVFKDDSDFVAMAIAQIQATFLERLKIIEAISGNVPIQASEPTWMKFAGVFKDDPDFVAIMESIRAERTSDDESEVDPSYYL
jgi:predicted RNase H-like HicB family nuclease